MPIRRPCLVLLLAVLPIATMLPIGQGAVPGPVCPPHPHPCGDEWPADAPESFHLDEKRHLPIKAHDGVVLDGYVWLPNRTDVEQVPVVLTTMPYPGQCFPAPGLVGVPQCWLRLNHTAFDETVFWANHRYGELIEAGYAVALYSVRGTGASEGCFELLGPNERQDHATLVEALAAQPWSNGHVGMWGLSYMGSTPWLAAVQAPEPLKAIVTAGAVTDFYRTVTTPQGAMNNLASSWYLLYSASLGIAPPAGAWVPENEGWAMRHLNDPCVETGMHALAPAAGQLEDTQGDRSVRFFADRRAALAAHNVTAATWVIQGLDESRAHSFQVDTLWDRLPAATPKRFTWGDWGHVIPNATHLAGHPDGANFTVQLLGWFDHWLKGVAPSPRTGVADHQDQHGDWHEASAWPPPDGHTAILYLNDPELTTQRQAGAQTLFAAPVGERGPDCDITRETDHATSLSFTSEPIEETTHIAGIPRLDLIVSSDQPGGAIAADLFLLAPGYDCGNPVDSDTGEPVGRTRIAAGAVDLRFRDGGLHGTDFPVHQDTPVPVELSSLSTILHPGERIGLVLTAYGWWGADAAPYTPRLTIQGSDDGTGSRLLLPTIPQTIPADGK